MSSQLATLADQIPLPCQWCGTVALLTDSRGEMLCLECRAAIAIVEILSSVAQDKS